MKITLLVMTLNEITGMKEIMPKIDRNWVHQILVLDGGSTDGTIEWALQNGYQVYVQKKKGIRFAYFEALELIEGDVILTFSPDGNCVVEAIPALIEKIKEGYDMVIGSRYLNDAISEDDDLITAIGNWLFTRTINILHGGNYTDAMVILRAYKKQLVYDLDLDLDESYNLPEFLFSTIISWEPLLSIRAAKSKLKVTELPFDEPERLGGERKLQVLRWGAAYYFQFWRELWYWKPGHLKKHPLNTQTITGEIVALESTKVFTDGVLFSSIIIQDETGKTHILKHVFATGKIYPCLIIKTKLTFYIWNQFVFGVRDKNKLVEDILNVKRSLLKNDALLILLMSLSVVLLPYATFIIIKKYRKLKTANEMNRTLRYDRYKFLKSCDKISIGAVMKN